MKIGHIDFPQEVIDAQRKGDLVIFSGAGVSMGPPSSLPDFPTLADRVSEGAYTKGPNEPLDRFLGRMEREGVHVEDRVRTILSPADSRPTPLHLALLSLFRSPSDLRLVTTNLDAHFTTAAKEVFTGGFESYCAPALPLGSEFCGVVYLHGCIHAPSPNLILTDEDFGRAYLTQGWATRFLVEMFQRFVVLFVGYSHEDVVMNYLARALPPRSRRKRYTLAPSGKEQHWIALDINRVTYRKSRKADKHIYLLNSIEAWSNMARMGALDHAGRIEQIAKSPPTIDAHQQDYLRDCLKDVTKIAFFTNHARDPEWLAWVDLNVDAFSALFDQSGQATSLACQDLSRWFASHFVCQQPEEAIALVQKHGQRLSPILWHDVVVALCFSREPPDRVTFAKWVSILVNTEYPGGHPHTEDLTFVLQKCRYPEDSLTMVLLFEYLTGPNLRLTKGLNLGDGVRSKVDFEVGLPAHDNSLRQSWEQSFKPRLDYFALRLEPIVTSHLRLAHYLLRSTGQASEEWDIHSYVRSAIEPHPQNSHRTSVSMLVDTARDIIEYLIAHNPERASAVVDSWAGSDVPLLRRLALHAVIESGSLTPDAKLLWVLDRHWLYAYALEHEVYRLLRLSFPGASVETRLRVLEEVEKGAPEEATIKIDRIQAEIDRLYLLHDAARDCVETATRLQSLRDRHPNYEPTPDPDLHWRVTTRPVVPPDPARVNELISMPAEKAIDELLSMPAEKRLQNAQTAARQSPEWGCEVGEALKEKALADLDIWRGLLRGWRDAKLSDGQWDKVLGALLEDLPQAAELGRDSVQLLLERVKTRAPIPSSHVPKVESIADRIWEAEATLDSSTPKDMQDWSVQAVSSTEGLVVNIWLYALSYRRASASDTTADFLAGYRQRFERALTSDSHAAKCGRVLLAGQMHFLFALDAKWTSDMIVPLLDWSHDKEEARRAWHGFVARGQLSLGLLEKLWPHYQKTFSHLDDFPEALQRQFCTHLAWIAMFGPGHPLGNRWLHQFLQSAKSSPSLLQDWAWAVGQQLSALDEDVKKHQWERWVKTYWKQRIQGIPIPVQPSEVEDMITWVLELEPVFEEAVEALCSYRPDRLPRIEHVHIFRPIQELGLATRYPDTVARLILHLLEDFDLPNWYHREIDKLVRILVEARASSDTLLKICRALAERGYPGAVDLEGVVRGEAAGR